jgi:small-conductance mechanosensitive channel
VADLVDQLPSLAANLILITFAIAGALLVHRLLFALLGRGARHSETGGSRLLIRRLCRPARWLFVALALTGVLPALELGARGTALWQRAAGLLTPALIGWLAVAVLGALSDVAQARARIDVPDNLRARRRRTRIGILYRIAVFAILLVTICLMLMSIPSVRNIGVTLIASAGLAGLAVGAAAQPALKNLIAGIQLAFTEPIRIDDVVIIDGEWGRIEEIRLTYVVVKVWDERRLIVPVSKFLESSFQNWTRQTSQLLGTVSLHLDPTVDVPRLRSVFERLIKEDDRWDGRVAVLQVVEVHRDAMEVRALISAEDAGKLFDLRCDIREAMMAFIAREMPEALPRRRDEVAFNPPEQPAPRLLERIAARR